MASPTDFIEVVSCGFAPSNFSKSKRGILTTTQSKAGSKEAGPEPLTSLGISSST